MRVGIVGLGYWGPNLARAAAELDSLEIAALCDVDPVRLAAVGRRYRHAVQALDIEQLLDDDRVDALLLATPIETHYQLAKLALEAGKHVFVEKPMAQASAECQELIALASARELVLMPGHTFLYSAPVVRVKEMIERRELGELYFVTSTRVNLGIHQSGSSVIYDLAPHDLSILRYWLGMPMFIRALGRDCIEPGVWDVAFIDLGFASGTVARIEVSWLAPTKLRRTVIAGSEAMAIYDDTSNEQLRIYDCGVELADPMNFGEHRMAYRTGDIVSPHLDTDEPLRLQLHDFVQSIIAGASLRSDVELGADVVRMVEAAELSMRCSGGAVPLSVPPTERRRSDRRTSPHGMPWFGPRVVPLPVEVGATPAQIAVNGNGATSGANGRPSAPNGRPSSANGRPNAANGRPSDAAAQSS